MILDEIKKFINVNNVNKWDPLLLNLNMNIK